MNGIKKVLMIICSIVILTTLKITINFKFDSNYYTFHLGVLNLMKDLLNKLI